MSTVSYGPPTEQLASALERFARSDFLSTDPIFVGGEKRYQVSLSDVWDQIDKDELYRDIPRDGSRMRAIVHTNFSPESDQIFLPIGETDVLVTRVSLEVDLWIDVEHVPPERLRQYASETQVYAEGVEFVFKLDGEPYRARMYRHPEAGTMIVEVEEAVGA